MNIGLICIEKHFVDETQKSLIIKGKIVLTILKSRTFIHQINLQESVCGKGQGGEEFHIEEDIYYPIKDKGLVSKIYKELLKVSIKSTNITEKQPKDIYEYFTEKETYGQYI